MYQVASKVVTVETVAKGSRTLAMLRTPDLVFYQRLVNERDQDDVRAWCRECDDVMAEKNLRWR